MTTWRKLIPVLSTEYLKTEQSKNNFKDFGRHAERTQGFPPAFGSMSIPKKMMAIATGIVEFIKYL